MNAPIKIKVAIYVRVSTQEQVLEGYSIPAQITVLKNYCASFQHIVYKVYHDLGISGKNVEDRPSLRQLIEDAKAKKFDCVLVWKLNRLSRKLLDILSVVDIFTQNNISFVSFSEKFDTSTATGKMMLQMLGSIAEFERNTIVENVKLGMNERFQQGLSKGSKPFGYTYEDKKAVIVPDQAEAVKYMFETYDKSDGNCITDLADYLNAKGYKTRRNGLWTRQYVRSMLSNPFYIGYVSTGVHVPGGRYKVTETKEGQHEGIISKELFESVNNKINSRKRSVIRSPDNDNLVTGLVICPLCGGKMVAHSGVKSYRRANNTLSFYDFSFYRCDNKKGRTGCKGFYLSSNKIDPGIYKILNSFKNKKTIKALIKAVKEKLKKSQKPINNKLELLDKQLNDAYVLRDKYYKLFDTGKVDIDKFADKINEILATIEELEKLKNEHMKNNIDYSDTDIIEIWAESISNNINSFDEMDNKTKKEFIREIIKEVKISESKELVSVTTVFGLEILYH
jgi:site-specific DNA recombinase